MVDRRTLLYAGVLLAACGAYAIYFDVFGETTDQTELCVSARHGEEVSVVGFATLDDLALVQGRDNPPVIVSESIRIRKGIAAYLTLGTTPNTMAELPRRWAKKDFQLNLSDGTQAGYNDRIVVTGVLTVDPEGVPSRQCYIATVTGLSLPD